MNIVLWHNILWSPYKAGVFSALARSLVPINARMMVYQICETDRDRLALSGVDRSIHQYPHTVLFETSRDQVLRPVIWARVLARTIADRGDVTIISGIDRFEYWLQAVFLWAAGRPRAVFYDSTANDRPRTALKRLGKRVFFAMVPNTLSYGERARSFAIANGVAPDHAFIRCQASYLPADYQADRVMRERGARAPAAGATVFLYVGRLSREKGLRTLLAAFDRLADAVPGARLRLVGAGPKLAVLRDLTTQMRNGTAVELVGPLSGAALDDEYLGATALILPSASEPWGLVVNEALHFGCPVIVSDHCGCVPELVANSPCGIVVPPDDSAALANALQVATDWAADPIAVARQCLDKIAPFTAERAASQILQAVQTILARGR